MGVPWYIPTAWVSLFTVIEDTTYPSHMKIVFLDFVERLPLLVLIGRIIFLVPAFRIE